MIDIKIIVWLHDDFFLNCEFKPKEDANESIEDPHIRYEVLKVWPFSSSQIYLSLIKLRFLTGVLIKLMDLCYMMI